MPPPVHDSDDANAAAEHDEVHDVREPAKSGLAYILERDWELLRRPLDARKRDADRPRELVA